MPDIHIIKNHQLSLTEAKQVALKVADDLQKQYGLKGEWLGNVLKFQKTGVKGQLSVAETNIDVQLSLSLPLSLMRRAIQSEIERNLDKIFG